RLDRESAPGEPDGGYKDLATYRDVVVKAHEKVLSALDDDLNAPVALAEIAEVAKMANDLCDLVQKRSKDAKLVGEGGKVARRANESLRASLDVLGLLHTPARDY